MWLEIISKHLRKSWSNIPLLFSHFSVLSPPLLSTHLLFALEEGRFLLIVVTSKQAYMGNWFEKTNFSQRDSLKWRSQAEEEILLTVRNTLLKEQVLCFLLSDSTESRVGQWTLHFPPSRIWIPDLGFCMAHSEYKPVHLFSLIPAASMVVHKFLLSHELLEHISRASTSWSLLLQLIFQLSALLIAAEEGFSCPYGGK